MEGFCLSLGWPNQTEIMGKREREEERSLGFVFLPFSSPSSERAANLDPLRVKSPNKCLDGPSSSLNGIPFSTVFTEIVAKK